LHSAELQQTFCLNVLDLYFIYFYCSLLRFGAVVYGLQIFNRQVLSLHTYPVNYGITVWTQHTAVF